MVNEIIKYFTETSENINKSLGDINGLKINLKNIYSKCLESFDNALDNYFKVKPESNYLPCTKDLSEFLNKKLENKFEINAINIMRFRFKSTEDLEGLYFMLCSRDEKKMINKANYLVFEKHKSELNLQEKMEEIILMTYITEIINSDLNNIKKDYEIIIAKSKEITKQ